MTLRARSGNGQLPWWFGVPFALGGLLVVIFGFVLLQDELRYGREGVSVTAVVTDTRYFPGGGDDGPSFEIRYSFVDPATGTSRAGQSDVDESTFDATSVGDAIEVTYLPADPNKSRVGSPDPQLLVPLAVLGGGALFTLVGVGLLILTHRIRRNGAPAWLQITSAAIDAENAADAADAEHVDSTNPFATFMTAGPTGPVTAPPPPPDRTGDGQLTSDELSALDARLASGPPDAPPGTTVGTDEGPTS